MTSGKKAESCIPCARRKVRCDKVQPCCHCKRRRQDTCVYPEQSRASHRDLRGHADRITLLERYIRSLGGDPKLADEAAENARAGMEKLPYPDERNMNLSPPTYEPAPTATTSGPAPRALELVSQGENVTCVETPIWSSWSSHENLSDPHRPNTRTLKSHYEQTILNAKPSDTREPYDPLSTNEHLKALWPIYLKAVHPLVKIFFDWDIEGLIQKSQCGFAVSAEEETLLHGIRFIATLALSPEECKELLFDTRPTLLLCFQENLEHALRLVEYTETTDKRVLQAFMLYILAMRNRARPTALCPLMGIASRIAERMGLHHDGASFGLSVVQVEERRRIWWQLQFMELATARLVGTLSLTIFAHWTTLMPTNAEDSDFAPGADPQTPPPSRKGLTSISPCLWRYSILQTRRAASSSPSHHHWLVTPSLSIAAKEAQIDILERMLAERFLQHCSLLDPLHIHMHIGIHQFLLAARSHARQPALVNARISKVSAQTREELLALSIKSAEYFVLGMTTPSIAALRWGNDMLFQVPLFIYLILEAHARQADPEAHSTIWPLIHRIYDVHPDLATAATRPDVIFIARLTLAAWRKRRESGRQTDDPNWICNLRDTFETSSVGNQAAYDTARSDSSIDPSIVSLETDTNIDLDTIDWVFWESLGP